MTSAREDLGDEKPRVKLLSPGGFGLEKSRLSSGFRSKGFAITELLGLEQQSGGGSALSGGGPGPGNEPQAGTGGSGASGGTGPGLGGFSFPGGSLPLGLGFLCSLAAQQPGGAPCFLPGHLPLLQARPEPAYLHGLDHHRDTYSGRILTDPAPSHTCPRSLPDLT